MSWIYPPLPHDLYDVLMFRGVFSSSVLECIKRSIIGEPKEEVYIEAVFTISEKNNYCVHMNMLKPKKA